jgi:hypothetical protein
VTTLLGSVAFAASRPRKPKVFTDDIVLVSVNGELLQRPYAPFHLREVTNEMAAIAGAGLVRGVCGPDGSQAVDNM